MTKKNKAREEGVFDETENVENVENVENAEKPKRGTKAIVITLSDGTTIKRVDFIRQRWQEGKSRSEIAAELSEIQGEKVLYQVVFGATKKIAGGPDASVEDIESENSETSDL